MPHDKPRSKLGQGTFRGRVRAGAFLAYVPQGYEPNYPYPVLVLLHSRGANEAQLVRLMPRLSTRNYVAVSLRGPVRIGLRRSGRPGYSWQQYARAELDGATVDRIRRHLACAQYDAASLDSYVAEALERVGQQLHIDPERIYLVGYGEGAAAAYRIALGCPARYAGLVAINGWFPSVPGPWLKWPEVRRLRALILHGQDDTAVPATEAAHAARILFTAGLAVRYQLLPGGHRLNVTMLNLINSWLIAGCRHPSPSP